MGESSSCGMCTCKTWSCKVTILYVQRLYEKKICDFLTHISRDRRVSGPNGVFNHELVRVHQIHLKKVKKSLKSILQTFHRITKTYIGSFFEKTYRLPRDRCLYLCSKAVFTSFRSQNVSRIIM